MLQCWVRSVRLRTSQWIRARTYLRSRKSCLYSQLDPSRWRTRNEANCVYQHDATLAVSVCYVNLNVIHRSLGKATACRLEVWRRGLVELRCNMHRCRALVTVQFDSSVV